MSRLFFEAVVPLGRGEGPLRARGSEMELAAGLIETLFQRWGTATTDRFVLCVDSPLVGGICLQNPGCEELDEPGRSDDLIPCSQGSTSGAGER